MIYHFYVPIKDDTANCHNTMLHHSKENNSTVLAHPRKIIKLYFMLSWPLIAKKLHAGCLNWNGYYDQDDGTVKHASTDDFHHAIENNTTA